MNETYTVFLDHERIESDIDASDVMAFLEQHDAERYRVNKYVLQDGYEYFEEELNGEDWLEKYTVVTQTRELI